MADYKRMYITLCKAADEVITELEEIPAANVAAHQLQRAQSERQI